MIWNLESLPVTCGRDAVHEHLHVQLTEWIGDRITHPAVLDDVAAALATAWQRDFRGAALPRDSLALMAARAMWRVGEAEAARALMGGMARGAGDGDALLALVEAGGPSLPACISLGTGVLRPTQSIMGMVRPCWTLDLTRLTPPEGYLAELNLPGQLRRLLTRTAEIWDRNDGDGELGIARPGPRASAHLVRLIREEVPDICAVVLRRIQADRGWRRCPSIHHRGL